MEIIKVVCILIALMLATVGVIMVYDARKLTKKWFGFNDQNEGSKWFKIGGFIICISGVLLILYVGI